MGLWDLAGLGDNRDRYVASQGLMGIAQGLLSQGPRENWGQALGRGFGQSTRYTDHARNVVDSETQRIRDEEMREYFAAESVNPARSDKDRMILKSMSMANTQHSGMLLAAMMGEFGQDYRQDSRQTFIAGEAGLGREHDFDMSDRGFQNQLGLMREGHDLNISRDRLLAQQELFQQSQNLRLSASLTAEEQRKRERFGSQEAKWASKRGHLNDLELYNKQRGERERAAANDFDQRLALGEIGHLRQTDLMGKEAGHQEERDVRLNEFQTVRDETLHENTLDLQANQFEYGHLRDRNRFSHETGMADQAQEHALDRLKWSDFYNARENDRARDFQRNERLDSQEYQAGEREKQNRFGLEMKKRDFYTDKWLMQQRYRLMNGNATEQDKRNLANSKKTLAISQGYRESNMELAAELDRIDKIPTLQQGEQLRALVYNRANDPSLSAEERDHWAMVSQFSPGQMSNAVLMDQQQAHSDNAARDAQHARSRAAHQKAVNAPFVAGAQEQARLGARRSEKEQGDYEYRRNQVGSMVDMAMAGDAGAVDALGKLGFDLSQGIPPELQELAINVRNANVMDMIRTGSILGTGQFGGGGRGGGYAGPPAPPTGQ